MNIGNSNIWLQASGDGDRDYRKICIEQDVILNGPGSPGPWNEQLYLDYRRGKVPDLRRFYQSMQTNDIVLLRLGIRRLHAVGVVRTGGPDGYAWNPAFSDVDGWDLQHTRRVEWVWKDLKGRDFGEQFLPGRGSGDTTYHFNSIASNRQDILTFLQQEVSEPTGRDLATIPVEAGGLVTNEQIGDYLFEHGVDNSNINTLLSQIDELQRISRWYDKRKFLNEHFSASEHETVAYLVIPLLRALGWTPQRMEIEKHVGSRRRADVVLFNSGNRSNGSIAIILEAKKLDYSCLRAEGQAIEYALNTSATKAIVTCGSRYGIFERDGETFSKLVAYLNLSDLRADYPIYPAKGALEALRLMSADVS